MAIIDVRQLRSFTYSEERTDDGTISAKGSVDLLVLSDTKNPSFADIKDNTDTWVNFYNRKIPQLGDAEPVGGITLYVTSRELSHFKDNDRAVVVAIKYENKPQDPDEPPKPDEPEFFQRFTFQTVQTTQPASESIPQNADDPIKPPRNSAQDPVDGLTEECALIRATYTNGRVVAPDFVKLWTYINKINQIEFLGAPKWTVRVTGIGADFDQKTQTWSINIEFTYKPDDWRIRYYDVGFNELSGGYRKAIVDQAGNPVSKPVALNFDGTAKAPGEEPNILKILPYEQAELNAMFADCGIL